MPGCSPTSTLNSTPALDSVKLALSILCENPARKTGLTTLFHEFIAHALPLYPEINWIVFAGPHQEWPVESPRVEIVRRFPANDRLLPRLWADHFRVPALARRLGATALLTVGFAPVRRCLPVVMHLFSLQHLDRSNRVGLARRIYRKLVVDRGVRTAALIVTNSRFAARQILGVFPGCRDRLTVSYEGLQHDQFTPDAPPGEAAFLREKLHLEPGYLLWVSNFYPYKQAGLLLEAYAQLDAAFRAAHPLVMAGGNWEGGKDAARARAAALGLGGSVVFPGWVDDAWLAPLYRQARVFVLASREETFGRCVVEAMACGTPCVVNDIPIMHEVTDGQALLVDFRDAAAAAAALRAVAGDDALRARLRSAGIERAACFDFDRLAAERIDAITDHLDRRRTPKLAVETNPG
jgi:glycosyltransferase involved in cell wall biosynthesis